MNDQGILPTLLRFLRMGRLAILVVFGVPILLCVGVGMCAKWTFGDGTLIAFTGEDAATLLLDGKQIELGPGTHKRIDVAQGSHKLVVSSLGQTLAATFDIESGLTTRVVAASVHECFAAIDVSGVFYEGTGKQPSVNGRMKPTVPTDGASSWRYDIDSLPSKVKKRESVNLVLPVDCAKIDSSDAVVIEASGVLAMRSLMDAFEAQEKGQGPAAPEK